jgi:L-asparaginase II
MLLLARAHGWAREGYHSPEHPLQQELLAIIAEAAGMRPDAIETATDGCGVVTFALSLRAMARAFASVLETERIADAMRTHPELVGGPEAIDTRLMRALPGAIAKRGAEGVLCAALPDGRAVALKVEDGARRALPAAASLFLDVAALADTSSEGRGDIAGRVSVL